MKLYFPALDSLRFFASLNIVLLHFASSHLLSYIKIERPFFTADVFFLLSGFIYSIMFCNKEPPKLGPFIKERFLRLYPLHIICTSTIFAIVLYRTSLLDNTAYAIKTLALHVSLLWAFVPGQGHHLNQPSWTLSVFFLCYAATPAFLGFLSKRSKKTLWILLAISILSLMYFKGVPNAFRGVYFFSGMLLGRLFFTGTIPLPKRPLLNDLLILLTVILICVNKFYQPVLYSALLLFLANNKGFFVKILSMPWLRAVGKASFYTYLLHGVAIEFLHLYLDKVAMWQYNPFNNVPATIIIMVVLYGSCTAYGVIARRFRGRG
ncbi:MAG: acyltransferase [Fibromonadales bacterium]|nr:acyltransferase [Fibromonadales bacterium]